MSAADESSMLSRTNGETTSNAPGPKYSISQRLFRPWALPSIGLAITVALWGFGYKISRYNPHPDTASRVLLAKLWDKHQDVTQLAASVGLSTRPTDIQLALHAVLLLLYKSSEPERYAFCPPDECRRIPALFLSLIPLRSPPSGNAFV